MLALGGAEVELAGFLRGPPLPPSRLPEPLVLGQTADARLGQRALAVARVLGGGMAALSALSPVDRVTKLPLYMTVR